MAYTVFLSSTRQDLAAHRDAVSLALRKAGYVPSEMETFGARDEEPLEACLQEVAETDLFVGIYAWRYGFVPAGASISITEQELREAHRRRKPILCFTVDEAYELPREEGEGAERLRDLKRRIRDERGVDTFTTPDNLAAAVLAALRRWEEKNLRADLTPARHVQLQLLDKVERFWVDGVLKRSVAAGRRLRIAREERPEAVGRAAVEPPPARDEPAPAGVVEPIHDLFEQRGLSLLILGPPGAGKTVTLLELAHGLGKRARRDPRALVPVVFNLASWKGHHRSLRAWMKEELVSRYQAGPEAAAQWTGKDEILPLLDGLDEVEPACRAACLDALNAHLGESGLTQGMAVCCHTQVYQDLPVQLRLESAVVLQPLAPRQVDEHLATGGPALAGVRAALAADAKLAELASSPLMLALIERAWEDLDPAAVERGLAGPAAERRRRVFEGFVSRMLEPQVPFSAPPRRRRWSDRLPWHRYRASGEQRASAAGPYPPERTRSCLSWLARKMAAHDPALFQLERLQPSWLESGVQTLAYALLSRIPAGGLVVLPLAVIFEAPELLAFGLAAGALFGLFDHRRLRRGAAADDARYGGRLARERAGRVLASGAIAFFLLAVAGPLWLALSPGGFDWSRDDRNLALAALLLSPLFGLLFGLRAAARDGSNDVRIAEALEWRRWSWRATGLGAAWGLVTGLAVWAIDTLLTEVFPHLGAVLFIAISIALAFTGGVLGGALGALGGRTLERKAWPNQGTWLALGNAGKVALTTALATAAALALVVGGLVLLGTGVSLRTLLRLPPQVGVTLGLWIGLGFSGLDFTQHFALRLVIRLWKRLPARAARFLDHARDRGLLDRPGGSYRFLHPQLQQHFAACGEEAPPRAAGAPGDSASVEQARALLLRR